jgi:outer membrane protein assembly factor BamB
MRRSLPRCLIATAALLPTSTASAKDVWPQFRGVNATGLAQASEPLPAEVGPETHVLWKTPLAPGHSSPVVWGDRVYVTAVREKKLLTIAVDAPSGKVLWEAEAPYSELEAIHSIGSYAQPSPVTDGERVWSFFGSSGLLSYDRDGKFLWRHPMGPFNDDYGAGSSPVLDGDRIYISQDHDTGSFIMALDKRSGETIWKTDRSEFVRSYSSPVVWEHSGQKEVVLAGTLRVVGYDASSGAELWTVRGFSRIANMTPVVGPDATLYAAGWAPGGDAEDHIQAATFEAFAAEHDKNRNGAIEKAEFPQQGEVAQRYRQIDRDKDGKVTREEYEGMRLVFERARNVVFALKPPIRGEAAASQLLWTYDRMLPYVPSPVWYNGHLFLVKNGGIVSCLDARTGEPRKQGRVAGKANYYSSPVAGDGKVYLLSERGEIGVLSAEPEWREIHTASFGERCYATPALVKGRIYLRTEAQLWCFGMKKE